MSHFLSQELDQLMTDVAARVAEIDAKVEQARANILAEFEGLAVSAKAKPAKATEPAERRGQKRTPEALAALTEELLEYLRQSPGQRVEQIAVGMGRETSEISLPLKKLRAEKLVTTKGQRRATTYTAKPAK